MSRRARIGTSLVLGVLVAAAGASGAAGGDWMFAFFAWGVALASLFAVVYWWRNPGAARAGVPLAAYLTILGVEALGFGLAEGGAAFRVGAFVTAGASLWLGVGGLRRLQQEPG